MAFTMSRYIINRVPRRYQYVKCQIDDAVKICDAEAIGIYASGLSQNPQGAGGLICLAGSGVQDWGGRQDSTGLEVQRRHALVRARSGMGLLWALCHPSAT